VRTSVIRWAHRSHITKGRLLGKIMRFDPESNRESIPIGPSLRPSVTDAQEGERGAGQLYRNTRECSRWLYHICHSASEIASELDFKPSLSNLISDKRLNCSN
jgi:hypothetical protein